jgi:hypothetical protein
VAELSAQIDELGLSLAMRQDIADAVELAAPAVQARLPDQPTVAALNNAAVDAHTTAVTAAVSGDEAALEAALAQHADALRALYDSGQSSAGPTPDQYRPAPARSKASHPLIDNQPFPSTDARQGRGVAGNFPLIGGGPLQGGPG